MSNYIRDFNQLMKLKGSDHCVFLGSGSSINNVTMKQWVKIRTMDVWTVNNWIYHPFIVPNFYHVEAKWYDYNILKRRFESRNVS